MTVTPEATSAAVIPRASPAISQRLRRAVVVLVTLGIAGVLAVWQFTPGVRPPLTESVVSPATTSSPAAGEVSPPRAEQLSPDLALYREMTRAVARGENYYTAAAREIPRHGFPATSTLNFRLPTYAWCFALVPDERILQGILLALCLVGLVLTMQQVAADEGAFPAIIATILQAGVLRWSIDGYAFYAQELWAAALIVIAIATFEQRSLVAMLALTLAALFRELALPLLPLAVLVSWLGKRRRDAVIYTLLTLALVTFYYWHHQQVQQVTAGLAATRPSLDLGQWLAFQGTNFWILATRMNSWLLHVPGIVVLLYLFLAAIGLADQAQLRARWMQLFVAAFYIGTLFIGRAENQYWGLIVAPMLSIGFASLPATLARWWRSDSASR